MAAWKRSTELCQSCKTKKVSTTKLHFPGPRIRSGYTAVCEVCDMAKHMPVYWR